jgi:hypothetical protein
MRVPTQDEYWCSKMIKGAGRVSGGIRGTLKRSDAACAVCLTSNTYGPLARYPFSVLLFLLFFQRRINWGSRALFRVISHPPVCSSLGSACAPCVFLCCFLFVSSIVRNSLFLRAQYSWEIVLVFGSSQLLVLGVAVFVWYFLYCISLYKMWGKKPQFFCLSLERRWWKQAYVSKSW